MATTAKTRSLIATVAVLLASSLPVGTGTVVASPSSVVERQSNSCSAGQTPNIVGTVTDPFGNPFPTDVFMRLSAETTGNPYGWGPVDPEVSTSTDAFGRYGLCVDVNSLRQDDTHGTLVSLQVVAKTTSAIRHELGDSPSAFTTIDSCVQRCTLDVTMTTPFVTGTIAGAQSLRVATSWGFFLADVEAAPDGTFSLALNPADRLPEGFGVGTDILLTAIPLDGSKVPIALVRQYNGATITIDDDPVFETSNIRLRLRDPGGGIVVGPMGVVVLTRTSGVDCVDAYRFSFWFGPSDPCRYRPHAGADGTRIGRIPEGDWTVTFGAVGYAPDMAEFTVPAGGGDIVVQRGSLIASGQNLDLQLSAGRIRFQAASTYAEPGGTLRSAAWLIRNSNLEYAGLSATGLGGGRVGWNPIQDGVYHLKFRDGAIETPLTVRVVGAPDQPVIDASCSYDVDSEYGTVATVCDQPAPTTDDQGNYLVDLTPPNFEFRVCAEGTAASGCEAPAGPFSGFQIERAEIVRGDDGWISPRSLESWGSDTSTVRLAFPDRGHIAHYRITVRPPWMYQPQEPLSDLVLYVRRNADGSIDRCGAPTASDMCPSAVSLNNPNGPWEWPEPLEFGGVPIIMTVVRPAPCVDDCGVSGSTVQIRRTQGFGTAAFEELEIRSTDSAGRVGLDLAPGHYRLTASAGEADLLGFVGGDIEITVGESGLATAVDGVTVEPTANISLPLRNPNITVLVVADGQPQKWADLEFEKWNSVLGRFEWTGIGSSTNDLGRFNLIVGDGRWRVRATPSYWAPIGDVVYTNGSQFFEVVGGSLSRVGACVVDQNLPCDSLTNELVVTLGTPNVSGVIKSIDPNTGVPITVGFANVDVQRRDPETGFYSRTDIQGRLDYYSGRFGLVLQPGTYRLTISGSTSEGLALPTTRKLLLVTAQGSCLIATDGVTSCATYASSFTLVFDPPNFQGRVRGSGQGWPASLTLYRYVPNFFLKYDFLNPISTWASNREGRFGLILEDGYYRLEANPLDYLPHNFGMAKLLVGINGSTWCLTTAVDGVPTPCQTWQGGDIDIDLPTGNFEAEVRYFNGTSLVPIPAGSVEVRKYVDQFSWTREQTIHIRSTGRFSLRLDDDAFGSSPVVRYDLVIDPSWAVPSAGLARRVVTVWLGDFDDDGSRDDLCSTLPVDGACSDLVSGLQQITVSTGNFTARVIDATTGDELESGSVSIQGWGPQCWQSGVDCYVWTFLRPGGLISSDLVPGRWMIQVSPPGDSLNLVGRTIQIHVVSASKWCLPDDFETLRADCVQPADFEIELPGFNVSAVIERDGQPIPNAWVEVQKKESAGTSTWWSSSGEGAPNGTLTRADGSFINHRPDGQYRLVVNPPYDNPLGINRFTREFSVVNGVDDLPAVVEVPDANLSFRLVDADGDPVPQAFVYLEKLNADGWWQWADMWSFSTGAGQVGLLISSSGRYRLVIEPRNRTDGLTRFTRVFEVTVDGQGALTFVGAPVPADVIAPRANLAGSVTTDGTTTNDDGWIEVRQAGVYVTSTNVDQGGNYGLFLEDGTYQVRFHPNYRDGASQPIDIEVVLSNGIVDSWRYLSQISSTDNCPVAPCQVDVNLSFDPPNVRIDVTVNQLAVQGVFVVLTRQENGVTISSQFVTDENGSVAASMPLGSYQLSVVYAASDGTTVSSVRSITVDETTTVSTPFPVDL